MPITKSAKKALKQSLVKRARNIEMKKKYKAAVKAATAKTLPEAQKQVDKAVKLNLLSKNKAARIKSRIAKAITTGIVKPVVKKKAKAKVKKSVKKSTNK